MPYENYYSVDEFHAGCQFWPEIENHLNRKFTPNPWRFSSGCKVTPQEFRYVLTYRNFDGSQELVLTAERENGAIKISNVVTRSRG